MIDVSDFVMLLVEHDPAQVELAQETIAQANLVNPLRTLDRVELAMDYLSGKPPYDARHQFPFPSLLLLDADLPDSGARRLLEWLREQPRLGSLPVVLLASSGALESCAAAVARKPLDLEGLLQILQSVGMYWMILHQRPAPENGSAAPLPAARARESAPALRRQDTDILGHEISFKKTSWDLVRAARNSEAMDDLIRIYWKPLYFFVRQKGYDNETAKDMVQDFLTNALERNTLLKADPARGRFRTFLLAALTNFIKDWNRASARLKRGGGHAMLSLDFEGGEQEYSLEMATAQTPEALFHRAWAQALLAQCISELKGKPSHLQAFEVLMRGGTYDEICRETGLNESAAKTAIHRLRHQLREILLGYIGRSVKGEEDLELALADFASCLL
ncbi:MAG TPA: sigma-70 family RNA polymerase sigma factor [Planctomycetota bacterium]|jgi:RNA polymerase sigma-70 factor (ECF subfamily)|nr:sigma-70 family RNA polymerase sigma factor [Planctomycetota bacterium]